MLGGFSPTIASYIALKKNNVVTGFKQWLKNVFSFKASPFFYLFVFILFVIPCITRIFIYPGLDDMSPLYMFFALLPAMIIGGGVEEAGWRYILQPELEKKDASIGCMGTFRPSPEGID
jgi:membrane protease YdiL (CAAX protease family)